MQKKNFIIALTIGFMLSISSITIAQDQTLYNNSEEQVQVEENLDSLLSLWYIKNSLSSESNQNSLSENSVIYCTDSVYMDRLSKIPTTFPLVYNDKVKSWIELYIKRGKYLIPTLVGLSDYYFPIFEEILDSKQIPLELKYLPIVESALNPRAVSRAGATGLWQFMYSTGKMYNLEISTLVDDRKDPIKSTMAAAQFLSDLYDIYGDWALVIAAYNCGPGNVNKAIKRSGGKTNFWEIYQYLPKETRGYVPAFISVTYIMTYYKEHNYSPIKVNMPVYTDTIMVNNKLHLMQVAEVLNIPVEQLRDMNPQYRKDIIPGEIKSYSLKVPMEYSAKFVEKSNEIYAYRDTFFFNPKNSFIDPPEFKNSYSSSSESYEAESPCANSNPPTGSSKLIYTVKQGDTFGFIANWYEVSVAEIKCWNNYDSNKLSIGQSFVIYVPTKKINRFKDINSLTFEQKQSKTSNSIVASSVKTAKPLDANFEYYTIKKGDNLSTIASKYQGISDKDIMQINGFNTNDVRKLQIGQVIKIKRKN